MAEKNHVSDVSEAFAPSTPLWGVVVFTWLNSLGTGAIANGVYFITQSRYGFSPRENLTLGVFAGVIYIAGALLIGRLIRRLEDRYTFVSPRGALLVLMVGLAAASVVPLVMQTRVGMWIFVGLYMPMTGGLWPILESYLSGGRRGAGLRRAIGAFNLSWATAAAAAYWAMAPLLENRPLWVIAGLGVMHVLCVPVVVRWGRAAASHVADGSAPHPEVYERLLPSFRWLLLLSYVLLSALAPILPWRLDGLGVEISAMTLLASVWMVSRVMVFQLFRRWDGWHGRWGTAIWTGGTMVAGFVVALTASDVWVFAVGLAVFGAGAGGVYSGALYYAMEVGSAGVEAGGGHEATIGVGYALGPLLGLIPWWGVGLGMIDADAVIPSMLVLVAGVCAAMALMAFRASRSGGERA